MNKELSSIGCPLCAEISETVLTDKLRRGDGRVFYCSSCEHGFLDLKPEIDMKDYYREEYRKEYSNRADVSSTNAQEIFDVYNQYQDSRLEIIRPILNKNKSLLEVGLRKINIKDGKNGISDWLDGELKALNKSYVNRLIDTKSTSNIMMVISID